MTESNRALMPDYLRLFALFGIVVVNVQSIAFSFEADIFIAETSPADAMAMTLVYGLAFMKSFGLFSFMFGVGLGFLMQSAERRGLAFGRLYRNRMLGLLLLGFAHGCLFFPGDILVTYAVFGTVLYFTRNWSVKRLVWIGALVLTAQILLQGPFMATGAYFAAKPEFAVDALTLANERDVMTNGTLFEVFAHRAVTYLNFVGFTLTFQGSIVLGWFCLGLAAVKASIIDDADHPIWSRARRFCLVPGVALSLIGAWQWQWGDHVLGAGLVTAASPIATLGYLGVIAALSRPPGPFMSKILAAGRNSLTVYLGQSILLSTIFAGYGLGLWEEVGRFTATLTAICVTILLMIGVTIWTNHFKLGPFEWVLRKMTYFGTSR